MSVLTAGGGLAGWAVWYVRSGRAQRLAAAFSRARYRDLEELKTILDQQRKGYDHLSERVDRLESEVNNLEAELLSARKREKALAKKLRTERLSAGEKIKALELELMEARRRIEELEEQLRRSNPTEQPSYEEE